MRTAPLPGISVPSARSLALAGNRTTNIAWFADARFSFGAGGGEGAVLSPRLAGGRIAPPLGSCGIPMSPSIGGATGKPIPPTIGGPAIGMPPQLGHGGGQLGHGEQPQPMGIVAAMLQLV
jgi:hypothetical protein